MSIGIPCTRHRVFLATLIVAAKYLHDSSPKNKHWAIYAEMFDIAEINLMERQLLYLLEFDLRFDEAEACVLFGPFMGSRRNTASMPMSPEEKETRSSAISRVSKAGKARAQAQAPPTPPSPAIATSGSTLVSAVRSLAKRISHGTLRSSSSSSAISNLTDIHRNAQISESSISPSMNLSRSSSLFSVEMGSLISDTGSTSSDSGDSEVESLPDIGVGLPSLKKFTLKAVPSTAYKKLKQSRRVSETPSVMTVRGEASASAPSSPRSAFDEERDAYEAITEIPLDKDPRTKDQGLSTSASFLSRMWSKAQGNTGTIDIVEPRENLGGGTSAFRRLVRRGGAGDAT